MLTLEAKSAEEWVAGWLKQAWLLSAAAEAESWKPPAGGLQRRAD
jgi:hypothetical protein